MRRGLPLAAGLLAVLCTVGTAPAEDLLPRHRVRRLSGVDSMQSLPFTIDVDAPACSPLLPRVPDLIGPGFDPGGFALISVAGDGRHVAYSTQLDASGAPTLLEEVVRITEGVGSTRIGAGTGDADQPCIRVDRFGVRTAFRASTGPAGTGPTNIRLDTENRLSGESDTIDVTAIAGDATLFARDPSLTARIRHRELQGEIVVAEQDARIAFVSNADLDKGRRAADDPDPGRNPDNLEQVFVWYERARRIEQVTRNDDPAVTMARPQISADGSIVVFESTGDHDPSGVDPADLARIGNPGGERQLFRWRRGRGVSQITWSDGPCFAPRMDRAGRVVLFCSSGDPVTGGNPERNFEIFRWRLRGRPSRRLHQLTQTAQGDSVLPAPSVRGDRFAFYSTAQPPRRGPDDTVTPEFGDGPKQCVPHVLLYGRRGRVSHLFGLLDVENAALVIAGEAPVVTGPPAVGLTLRKVQFATNDSTLDPADGGGESSELAFHLARATRYPRR